MKYHFEIPSVAQKTAKKILWAFFWSHPVYFVADLTDEEKKLLMNIIYFKKQVLLDIQVRVLFFVALMRQWSTNVVLWNHIIYCE